jgi:hypothetical protein
VYVVPGLKIVKEPTDFLIAKVQGRFFDPYADCCENRGSWWSILVL